MNASLHSKSSWTALITALILLLLNTAISASSLRATYADERASRAEVGEREAKMELVLVEIRAVDRRVGALSQSMTQAQRGAEENTKRTGERLSAIEQRLARVEAVIGQGDRP